MKIVVTYEEKDIIKMVRLRLAKRGIEATAENIVFKKNSVVVSVDNVDEGDADDDDLEATPVAPVASAPEVTATPTPPLTVVDGGNAPVDMDAILRASQKNAANPGKFPVPERQLMDGESFDYPGGDKR